MNRQIRFLNAQPAPKASRPTGLTAQQTMACLAVSMGLQATSFVIILPLFARRFTELGAGVDALGASSMAYALAATVCAPFLGALADRIGRRPIVLGSLAVYAAAFTGFLLATSASTIILLRGIAGALTAGMMPAATGMVADLAPENRRARWIGILSGGASIGWIAGPVLGGLLYDNWGFAVALLVSIGMAMAAFLTALLGVRETRAPRSLEPVQGAALRLPNLGSALRAWGIGLRTDLAGSLVVVLLTYFAVMFAWAFIEPRYMFYVYDELKWSSSMLGLAMSTYGIAMAIGEFALSRLSDDLGRKPVIIAGLLLFSAQFLGMALSRDYLLITASFTIAGLGNALFDPALSAAVLDVTPSTHQARMLGLKSTIGSLGNILGPALVVLSTSVLRAQTVFLISAGVVFLVMFAAILDLSGLKRARQALHRQAARVHAD